MVVVWRQTLTLIQRTGFEPRLHGCRTTARRQELEQRKEQLPRWSGVRGPPGAPMFQFSGSESLPDYVSSPGRLPLVILKPAGPP